VTVLLVLAAAWVVALVPSAVRGRAGRKLEQIGHFDRIRGSLGGVSESAREETRARPAPRLSPARRKRRVLKVIAFALMATLAVAVQQRTRLAWGMHLLVYDVLLAYLALIARARQRAGAYPKTSGGGATKRMDSTTGRSFSGSESRGRSSSPESVVTVVTRSVSLTTRVQPNVFSNSD
jgi:peptidoglycan/LPS O-acetylase OafA/YrhL